MTDLVTVEEIQILAQQDEVIQLVSVAEQGPPGPQGPQGIQGPVDYKITVSTTEPSSPATGDIWISY